MTLYDGCTRALTFDFSFLVPAKLFLETCLQVDFRKRCSAHKLLSHPLVEHVKYASVTHTANLLSGHTFSKVFLVRFLYKLLSHPLVEHVKYASVNHTNLLEGLTFSKVLYIVTQHRKFTTTLTFFKMCA